jgi:hypothetical protein
VLVAALMAMVLVNGWLLRRRFAPLESSSGPWSASTSAGATRAGDPDGQRRGGRAPAPRLDRMLERLEAERARTATAVLQAQEGERARLARDLHDEANQALTGVLLRLEATAQDAPPALRAELRETQGVATQAMGELVRLARELRPVALDDLGLGAALRTQVDEFGRRAGRVTSLSIPVSGLEDLDADEQIVRLPHRPGGSVERGPPLLGRATCAWTSSACRAAPWCGWPTTERLHPSVGVPGLGICGMRERSGPRAGASSTPLRARHDHRAATGAAA